MIVQPDFLEHWKTRLLVDMTGDPSSPLCIIRLWAHCQNSKREYFPDMTPAQLASVCHWGNRKPACHVALVRCKFVSKLSPAGYAAHEWSDHNRQLIQKWEAGKNGGRPKIVENTNELPLFDKPTDNRPITARELDRTDELEQIDKREQNRTDRTDRKPGGSPNGSFLNSDSGSLGSGSKFSAPHLEDVQEYLSLQFRGAEKYATKWFARMVEKGWRDDKNQPVKDWMPLAKAWANACAQMDMKPARGHCNL